MNLSKYRNLTIIYGLFLLILIFMFLILGEIMEGSSQPFLNLVPFGTGGTSIYLCIMVGIGSIIGAVFVGFIFGPIFLFVHKKIIGSKMIYGLQDRPQEIKLKGTFLKLLFPALFTVNLCLMFYDNSFIARILILPQVLEDQADPSFLVFSGLLPFMAGLSAGIFSPVWFLLDGGIVYTNKEKVKDRSDPIEMRSVGGWYMYLLKGYAGITVILNYYTFLTNLFTGQDAPTGILLYLLWPIMPFLIVLFTIPCIIALDITFEKRRKFIQKWAGKIGITSSLEHV